MEATPGGICMTNELPNAAPPKQEVGGILGWIERMGNRIPDITMLFICDCGQ